MIHTQGMFKTLNEGVHQTKGKVVYAEQGSKGQN